MRLFVTILLAVVATCSSQQHQQVDPAYLRQYYSQIAAQTGAEGSQRAAPIYESQEQPEYLQQSAPLKNVSWMKFHPLLIGWRVDRCKESHCNLMNNSTVPKTTASTTSLRPRASTASSQTVSITATTGNFRLKSVKSCYKESLISDCEVNFLLNMTLCGLNTSIA